MKILLIFIIFTAVIADSNKVNKTKVDSNYVRTAVIDTSLIRVVKEQKQIAKLYVEQTAQIKSIRGKLKDPKVVKKLRKKLKK